MSPQAPEKINSVEELRSALRIASELEHGLCCQYLFAAFSLRRSPADLGKEPSQIDAGEARLLATTQQWAKSILTVARQEMEHLAIVLNLMAATGTAPHLGRPEFPVPQGTYPIEAHFCLERLDRTALERFVFYEKPDDVHFDFDDPGCCADETVTAGGRLELESHGGLSFHSVQQLYQEILNAFWHLPAAELFTGDPARQVTSGAVQWGFDVSVPAVYNRQGARDAIVQIVEEGEGRIIEPDAGSAPDDGIITHYARFREMLDGYDGVLALGDPAMPVACNPWPGSRPGVTPVTNDVTRQVMELFDAGYGLMVAMIRDFFLEYRSFYGFFPPWEPDFRAAALFHAAYYPLMTLLVRPVGEMLCRLPVAGSMERTAGPSFALPGGVGFGAEHELGWYLDGLRDLEARAKELQGADFPERGYEHRQTFTDLERACHRLTINFERLWTGRGSLGGPLAAAEAAAEWLADRVRKAWRGGDDD